MVTVVAPLSGTMVPLDQVPDDVFSQGLVGWGTAMRPTTPHVNVIAPVTGRVSTIFPHGFALDTPDGAQILVHLGIDTISLHGDGFTLHHNQGDTVTQGELMITWDTTPALAAGLNLACPILAVQHPRDALHLENVPRDPHQPVTQGVPLFHIDKPSLSTTQE